MKPLPNFQTISRFMPEMFKGTSHRALTTERLLKWTAIVILLLNSLVKRVNADCECGYSQSINGTSYLFTDLLESDFLHLANISLNTDWTRQGFNVTSAVARGPYGESLQVSQVVSNPLANNFSYAGPSQLGGDAGLQLFVRGGIPSDGLVPVAEVNSVREDMLWGSYRAAMKLTLTPGTCGAFFWYFNDSQEIDMEFLSSQFDVENNTFPVNLVLQSAQSVAQGYNAAGTGNYIVANLPFNPTDGFHEYRMDFVPGSVIFYADGHVLATMNTSAIPTQAGHLILTHWSNGNPLWSGGPPSVDAVMTVSYVKSYFNSSLVERTQAFESRCRDPHAPNTTCSIPDQKGAPDPGGPNGNASANTYFFINVENQTTGQIVYHQDEARQYVVTWQILMIVIAGLLINTGFLDV